MAPVGLDLTTALNLIESEFDLAYSNKFFELMSLKLGFQLTQDKLTDLGSHRINC